MPVVFLIYLTCNILYLPCIDFYFIYCLLGPVSLFCDCHSAIALICTLFSSSAAKSYIVN